jgi:hypothetical protein
MNTNLPHRADDSNLVESNYQNNAEAERSTSPWIPSGVFDAPNCDPRQITRCGRCRRRGEPNSSTASSVKTAHKRSTSERIARGCCVRGYDPVAAVQRRVSQETRRKEFVDGRGWRFCRKQANICRMDYLSDGRPIFVTVFLSRGEYGVVVRDAERDTSHFHHGRYSTQENAVRAAFNYVEVLWYWLSTL